MSTDREAIILQVTEDMIRQGGYHRFSFRNIATAVGIKSSSVHYHFATKEQLGVAVTKHYTDKFINSLGQPQVIIAAGGDPVHTYIEAFRAALKDDKGICLCGMLGAETAALPSSVANETRAFFERNIAWLDTALKANGHTKKTKHEATKILALLEGAMIVSNVMDDVTVFDMATESLLGE
ncbi:MAG: TetR/AcrR family transcriptional repressor of nem operon [Cryomorphaceae bacterium]|jgi:TetR/AcrR family transcriptional repressor of nem operon